MYQGRRAIYDLPSSNTTLLRPGRVDSGSSFPGQVLDGSLGTTRA